MNDAKAFFIILDTVYNVEVCIFIGNTVQNFVTKSINYNNNK